MTRFGHTQTWVPANDNDEYFVGAKPNSGNWTTQIARVKYPRLLPENYTSNTQLPRLSHLNHTTDVPYDGTIIYTALKLQFHLTVNIS